MATRNRERIVFPISRVDHEAAEATETLGTKPKFWFRDGGRHLLFKAEDRGTGEDWAEVIACHLCRLMGLPHVEYELADEFERGQRVRPGVICENMAPPPLALILGNQLLLERDPSYPLEQRFHVRQHTVQAVAEVVANLELPAASWMDAAPKGLKTALDAFVGYVVLDAWIANQDRHHENWAALRVDGLHLAPTYDHGASLARNLTDEERLERLTTKDKNRTVLAFAERGRSAFYNEPQDQRPMGLVEAARRFALLAPEGAAAWRERLAAINTDAVERVVGEIPQERMSEPTKEFTSELLRINQRRVLEGLTA